MSLRARDQKVFFVVCDRCERQSVAGLMPVEAEIRAAEGGWRTGRKLLTHTCPWCIEKGSAPLSAPAPSSHTATPATGR